MAERLSYQPAHGGNPAEDHRVPRAVRRLDDAATVTVAILSGLRRSDGGRMASSARL